DNIIAIKAGNLAHLPPHVQLQETLISGTVTDQSGNPLDGVTVALKGTDKRTTTNTLGVYQLSIPTDANDQVLIFSSIGFSTVEQPIDATPTINVSMKATVADLDEVIVVGYGTQKKASLTGAVSALDSRDFGRRQVGQSSLLLQGAAPGVTVTQRSGQPGRDAGAIRIRGNGTLGDNNPMILVDGVEMSMDNIDPETIESISVLKDAA